MSKGIKLLIVFVFMFSVVFVFMEFDAALVIAGGFTLGIWVISIGTKPLQNNSETITSMLEIGNFLKRTPKMYAKDAALLLKKDEVETQFFLDTLVKKGLLIENTNINNGEKFYSNKEEKLEKSIVTRSRIVLLLLFLGNYLYESLETGNLTSFWRRPWYFWVIVVVGAFGIEYYAKKKYPNYNK